jgi:SAM-dependent methyltransferase
MSTAPDATWVAGTDDAVKRRVAAYYDATQVLYSRLWSPTSVHYGLWEADTWSHRDAVRNLDRCVAAGLDLEPGARVLDAGCGVGGTSLFLAEEHGLDVVGITLSHVQLERARRLAAGSPSTIRPRFLIADYLRTQLASGSFAGVVAVESACHSPRKQDFLAEAYRLLEPGGRLVVADGFLAGDVPDHLAGDYHRLVDGMALGGLARVDQFGDLLLAAGFIDVVAVDKRPQILRSARRIQLLSWMGVLVCRVPVWLGLWPQIWLAHGRAGLSQRRLFESGILSYCIFSARKPGRRPRLETASPPRAEDL